MSVLTFLCFTSLIYFALADPVPPTAVESQDPDDIQTQVDALVAAIKDVMEKYLMPILKPLDPADQVYLKDITIDGIIGNINYAISFLKETDPVDDSIILTFLSPDGYSFVGVPDRTAGSEGH